MPARTAQVPSLRVLPSEKKLIESAAKKAGLSVTDWAREQLLCLAHEAVEVPREPKRPSSVVPKEPRSKGLDLDEETRLLLAGYSSR